MNQKDNNYYFNEALKIAIDAHREQYDKGGNPYILHPLRLANQFSDIELKIIALLHDVVEDSDVSTVNLSNKGFNENIINAVDALTRREDEIYDSFIQRVAANQLATKVKIADLKDNMDINRLPELSGQDFERLKKYKKALILLSTD